MLDTGTSEVTTWVYGLSKPGEEPYVLDRFPLG